MLGLLGEVRELGDDPQAWREHLLHGLNGLLGTRVGMAGEMPAPGSVQTVNPQVSVGFESNGDFARAEASWQSAEFREQCPFFGRYLAEPSKGVNETWLRCQWASDQEWYGQSPIADEMRSLDIDAGVHSLRVTARGTFDILTALPDWHQRVDERARLIVALIHEQVAPMIGRQLAAEHEPSPADLSPRKRAVLDLLLEGEGDKQIACELNLSRHTVNEYVSAIHKHFRVSSRAELLAFFLRRHRGQTQPSTRDGHAPPLA